MSPDLPIRTRQRLEAAQQAAENKRLAAQRPGQLEQELRQSIHLHKPVYRHALRNFLYALAAWVFLALVISISFRS